MLCSKYGQIVCCALRRPDRLCSVIDVRPCDTAESRLLRDRLILVEPRVRQGTENRERSQCQPSLTIRQKPAGNTAIQMLSAAARLWETLLIV